MVDQALFGLLHVLVFVYWLGGDLGAFYTSRYLTSPNIDADRRLMAAKIVGDVDMAPRTALILALPTGLALAQSKGWVEMGWPVLVLLAAAFLIWLVIAWKLHFTAHAGLKTLDIFIRWALIFALLGWAGSAQFGLTPLALFLQVKLVLFAGCVGLGLLIRRVLKPLGPALAGLSGPEAAAAEASLADTLNKARPLVLGIWALLMSAAILGLWTPTGF